MNIKRFDRKEQWGSDNAKRYFHFEFNNKDFSGIMALLYFDDVEKASTWKYLGKIVKVCEKGMKWLQFISRSENYAVTAMINKDNVINLWFIDVIAGYGYTEDNVVYFDDLYVDIILHPNEGYITDDTNDELKEALAEKAITEEMYSLALNTRVKVIGGLLSDVDSLSKFCMKYLHEMENIFLG